MMIIFYFSRYILVHLTTCLCREGTYWYNVSEWVHVDLPMQIFVFYAMYEYWYETKINK